MESQLFFGTFNVPIDENSISASFTVPSIAPKEVMERVIFSDEEKINEKSLETVVTSEDSRKK